MPEQMKQISMIQSSGRHLLSLISGILDLAKVEAGEMNLELEWFNISDVIEEVTRSILPCATGKGLEFIYSTNTEIPGIRSDKKKLTQVIMNIVNNAVKFTEKRLRTNTLH